MEILVFVKAMIRGFEMQRDSPPVEAAKPLIIENTSHIFPLYYIGNSMWTSDIGKAKKLIRKPDWFSDFCGDKLING